jgi:hypothetical protein
LIETYIISLYSHISNFDSSLYFDRKEQLEQYVSLGRCVAFEVRPKESSQLPTAEEPEIVMGDVWVWKKFSLFSLF